MSSTGPRVLIVGAGAIGCSIACFLAERGCNDVLVLDRGVAGQGSTPRAAGGLRAQFATEINIRFSLLSMPHFKHSDDWLGVQTAYDEVGYIFLARSAEQAEAFRRNVQLQRRLGVDSAWLSPEELERGWPYINPAGVFAATWCPTDALTDQVAVMLALADRARALGVQIREGVTVTGLLERGGRVCGVTTLTGSIAADVVVLAAGVWSPSVASSIGLDLPITASRREIFTTTSIDGVPLDMPFVADFDSGAYVRRDVRGFRINGATGSGTSDEIDVDPARFGVVKEWASSLLPALGATEMTGGWGGLTETTPDHHALFGRHPSWDGVIIATGFSGHGLMHAPAAGMLAAELILDGSATTIDISQLAPDRFERGAALAETMVTRLHEQGDIVQRPTAIAKDAL
jgi:sarcosine oxidase subunit beta